MINKSLVRNVEISYRPTRSWTNSGYMDNEDECDVNLIPVKSYYNKKRNCKHIIYGESSRYLPCNDRFQKNLHISVMKLYITMIRVNHYVT